MEVIPGKRKGSYLYVYQGFTYHIDKRYCYIYRCAKRRTNQCGGLLVKQNEEYILENSHNHPSEPDIVQILNTKSEMIEMCKTTTVTNKEIFDSISRRNPNAAAYISYNAMRSMLTREKLKLRPSLPSNVSDLDNMLQNYEPTKFIYKSCVISEDNKYSYIFTSDKLLKILEKSSEIFIDGTFSVVPKTPHFTQLFSVHVRYMDKGIAILFILCEARTQSVYKSIWKEIVKLAPGLQCSLRFIMTDYEKASMNAVHEQFPHASLRGCWFHYCQAVLRKWKRLELLTASHKVISMAMTLALAPSDMFAEGLNLIQMIADEESEKYPNILIFMKYMRNTWLPLSEKISVYGCPIRTNNLVESFHNIISHKMQTIHPNLWIFLDNISKIIIDQELIYDRLVNGLRVTRNRCQYNKYRNAKIKEAQNNLSTGVYSLKEFLHALDKQNDYLQYEITLQIDDNYENEICADFHKAGIVDMATCNEVTHRRVQRQRRNRRYNPSEFEDSTIGFENMRPNAELCSQRNIDDKQNNIDDKQNNIDNNQNEQSNVDDYQHEQNNIDDNQNKVEDKNDTEDCTGSHIQVLHTSNVYLTVGLEDMRPNAELCSQRNIDDYQKKRNNIDDNQNKVEDLTVGLEDMRPNAELCSQRNIDDYQKKRNNIDDNQNKVEEDIYGVPYNDYSYWYLEESKEEETSFLSTENIKSVVNKNSLYEEGTCVVCLVEKSKIAFIPCGHLCCCKNCTEKLSHERCPACNNTYSQFISIITP